MVYASRLLNPLVRISCDHIHLLLSGQINEFYRIAADADGKVRVFRLFRMFHGIFQLIQPEHVDIQMMCSLIEIAVQDMNKVFLSLLFAVTQGIRTDSPGANGVKALLPSGSAPVAFP